MAEAVRDPARADRGRTAGLVHRPGLAADPGAGGRARRVRLRLGLLRRRPAVLGAGAATRGSSRGALHPGHQRHAVLLARRVLQRRRVLRASARRLRRALRRRARRAARRCSRSDCTADWSVGRPARPRWSGSSTTCSRMIGCGSRGGSRSPSTGAPFTRPNVCRSRGRANSSRWDVRSPSVTSDCTVRVAAATPSMTGTPSSAEMCAHRSAMPAQPSTIASEPSVQGLPAGLGDDLPRVRIGVEVEHRDLARVHAAAEPLHPIPFGQVLGPADGRPAWSRR